jgi:hypothetical protein
MGDNFLTSRAGITDPANSAYSITPSDSAELGIYTRGIYVGTSGDLAVMMVSGDIVTFASLSAGVIHPIRVKMVYSTGTTATDIIGVY